MDHWLSSLKYISGELTLRGFKFSELAAQHGTPLYVYDYDGVEQNYLEYKNALADYTTVVCVSVKANCNLTLLSDLAKLGSGFDIVSGGELARALAAGADPKKIVFSGVGKSEAEITAALNSKILMINVESESELYAINKIANKLNLKAPVSIRVNPDVDAKTHSHISTGMKEHKFGIPFERARELYLKHKELTGITFIGVDCHIGSMIKELAPFKEAYFKIKDFFYLLKQEVPTLNIVDLGGGLAISYDGTPVPTIKELCNLIKEVFDDRDIKIVVEPGRSIFGNCGFLVTKNIYIKETDEKKFAIVDAGFNDLMRPLLYGSFHDLIPLVQNIKPVEKYDVVGPICETGDCFAKARSLAKLEEGDELVFLSAGAYGASMGSTYNARPQPAEVVIKHGRANLTRKRLSFEELMEKELQYLGKN